MENIVSEREKEGRFRNLIDFIKRVNTHQKEIENLILVGAFDGFGLTRPELLFLLDGVSDKAHELRSSLFLNEPEHFNLHLHPGLSDYSFMEKCLNELHLLGFMLSGDMVDILDLHPASRNAVSAKIVYLFKGKRIKVFGRKITERTHMIQKSGKIMKFLTIEDVTGCIDVIFWPDKFEIFSEVLVQNGPFEIWGTVTEERDTYTLEADFIRSVEWFPGSVDFNLASKRLEQSSRRSYAYEDVRVAMAG